MNPIAPILSIAEVVLNVKSIPRMRSFYGEVFGFSVHSQFRMTNETSIADDRDPTICFLKVLDTDTPLGRGRHPQMLVLIDYERHFYAARFGDVSARQSTLNHLAFEIRESEFENALENLRARGISTSLMSFPDICARSVFFSDPEDNRLELICHAEKGSGCIGQWE